MEVDPVWREPCRAIIYSYLTCPYIASYSWPGLWNTLGQTHSFRSFVHQGSNKPLETSSAFVHSIALFNSNDARPTMRLFWLCPLRPIGYNEKWSKASTWAYGYILPK